MHSRTPPTPKPMPRRRPFMSRWLSAGFMVGLFSLGGWPQPAAATAQTPPTPPPGLTEGAPPERTLANAARDVQRRRSPVVEVFQNCRDSVVNISATRLAEAPPAAEGLNGAEPPLTPVPNPPDPRGRDRRVSVGSGFVLHPSGYIITNAHVVVRTIERRVIFEDGREYEAQIIATDPSRDVAVLKIEPETDLPALPLRPYDDLMVGETVIAIGNPMGLEHTLTSGVVGATSRLVRLRLPGGNEGFTRFIQTDAAINPGNSGGPLLNVLGQLVGMNTALRSGAASLGFAIPVSELRKSLPGLLDVERRYGISTGLTLEKEGPASVVRVQEGSPADRIGFQAGDVIVQLEDRPVASALDFYLGLIGREPGDPLPLRVWRPGEGFSEVPDDRSGWLALGRRPQPDGARLLAEKLGVEALTVNQKIRRSMNLGGVSGLLVRRIEPGEPGDVSLQRGDIITQISSYPLRDLDEAGEVLDRLKSGQIVRIWYFRRESDEDQRFIQSSFDVRIE